MIKRNIYINSFLRSYIDTPENLLKNFYWRFPKTISKSKVIFILGCPRSGTTLLQRVLSNHNQLFSLDREIALLSKKNIFKRNLFGLSEVDNSELFDNSVDIVDYFQKGVHKLQALNSQKIFVEKTPQNVLHIDFLIKHFPNSKIVNIYRDGRDAFCSARKRTGIRQANSVRSFAKYWKQCIKSGFYQFEDRKEIVYSVKYENLVAEPISELSHLMRFLELEFQKNQIDPRFLKKDKRSLRKDFSKLNQPIDSSSCGRYKKELSSEENRIFLEIAGKEIEILGYPI